MRVAVYGGSFNPVHVVHVWVAQWLRLTGRAERVLVVPCGSHAFDKELAPFEERVSMCERAFAGIDGVSVSRIEEPRAEPNYTIETLKALQDDMPEARIRLVVGSDVLGEVERWKDWRDIEHAFRPIVVQRAVPSEDGGFAFPGLSSTEIRRRARQGLALDDAVPAVIVDDVKRLYGNCSGRR